MAVTTQTKLSYRLFNPGYTIYHRAALGGLAATIRAWQNSSNGPTGVTCEVTSESVQIDWSSSVNDQEALRRILGASFLLTDDKLIELPGQQTLARDDLRVIVHNAITQTFLQHPKTRPGEKQGRTLQLKDPDTEAPLILTYKPVLRYAHQTAQGTGLLDEQPAGKLPPLATIPQSMIPGAFTGARSLECRYDEAILLLYLIVGCSMFQLRPRNQESKYQHCIVVPDVIDLKSYARCVAGINEINSDKRIKSNSGVGRVVGGAEEAALRFLLDVQIAETVLEGRKCAAGCQVIAMGKVAWDSNQVNRSMSLKVRRSYPEIQVFETADEYWRTRRILSTKRGDSFIVPQSPVPELIAANLANDHHWCRHFATLLADKKNMNQMLFAREGLAKMKNALQDEDDIAIINAFQEAWRRSMASLFERATRDHLNGERLVEVEREKIRNAILRSKTSEMLAGWFLRFCADASGGGSLKSIRSESDRIRTFIFSPRNFERFQNLCLFALVSYESKTPAPTGAQT